LCWFAIALSAALAPISVSFSVVHPAPKRLRAPPGTSAMPPECSVSKSRETWGLEGFRSPLEQGKPQGTCTGAWS
jgi:hypothetical protein